MSLSIRLIRPLRGPCFLPAFNAPPRKALSSLLIKQSSFSTFNDLKQKQLEQRKEGTQCIKSIEFNRINKINKINKQFRFSPLNSLYSLNTSFSTFKARHFSTSNGLNSNEPLRNPSSNYPSSPPPPRRSIFFTVLRYIKSIVTTVVTAVVSLLALLLLFFIYDYSTYARESKGFTEESMCIRVPDLALHPRTGGPKNLPIFEARLDDYDDSSSSSSGKQGNGPNSTDETTSSSTNTAKKTPKPRLVVLGTGWGNVTMLKDELSSDEYDIIVISPTNYFLFTPLLPSATVGTLETRSLVEPIRNVLRRIGAHYLLAKAENILFDEQLVEVSAWDPAANEERRFYVPYDRIVVGVGSVTNNHGVKGLENCFKLKTVDDVGLIRKKVVENIEAACLPTTTDEERRRLLSFVVCGGGPTGVELAAELFDTVSEDLQKRYPKIVRSEVSVHIIQSRSHILNTYDESISKFAESRFSNDGVDVVTNSRVKQVLPDRVEFTQTLADGSKVDREIPFGLCVWSTGVDKAPLTRAITEEIGPEFQKNRRAIETDSQLRIIGAPLGTAYAIGDCATIRTDLVKDIELLLRDGVVRNMKYTKYEEDDGQIVSVTESVADSVISENATHVEGQGQQQDSIVPTFRKFSHVDDVRNLKLSYDDFKVLAAAIQKREPRTAVHMEKLEELFTEYDKNHDGVLSYHELCDMLGTIDRKVTTLPATAQRAAQQGKYLGRKLHRLAKLAKRYEAQAAASPPSEIDIIDRFGVERSAKAKKEAEERAKGAVTTSQDGQLVPVEEEIVITKKKYNEPFRWGGLRALFPGCPSDIDLDEYVSGPFVYHHLGSLAYIGNAAVFDMNGHPFFGGILAMYLWRSAYFAQTVSFRTRCLMAMDWLKRGMFGRDLSGV